VATDRTANDIPENSQESVNKQLAAVAAIVFVSVLLVALPRRDSMAESSHHHLTGPRAGRVDRGSVPWAAGFAPGGFRDRIANWSGLRQER
jgi:hypothetical protein